MTAHSETPVTGAAAHDVILLSVLELGGQNFEGGR